MKNFSKNHPTTFLEIKNYKSKILKPYARKFERSNILPRLCVAFSVGGKLKTQQVHSLVAKTFIPNPQGLETVNHKDGNTENNALSNLEVVTHQENAKHAQACGLYCSGKVWYEARGRVAR